MPPIQPTEYTNNNIFFSDNTRSSEISKSDRIISTPSQFARKTYFYVQEVGFLESIEPHISKRKNLNSFLFFIVLAGTGTLTYQNQVYELTPSDCVFLDCKKEYAHMSSVENPWKLMWVHFNGPLAQIFYNQFSALNESSIFHAFNTAAFEQTLTALLRLHKETSPLVEIVSNKYITDIITQCFMENKLISSREDTSSAVKLRQIRELIDINYAKRISLEALSDEFYISKFHLSREFKKAYGCTIGSYILGCRISASKKLLRFSAKPIEEIAILCGISDTSYFTKVFRKSEHMTALQYRKKWGSK